MSASAPVSDRMSAMDESSGGESDGSDWEEWTEGEESQDFKCLFCEDSFSTSTEAFSHMTHSHSFNFQLLQKQGNWKFYESIRVLNYIRTQVRAGKCMQCKEEFQSNAQLCLHMAETKHYILPVAEPRPWLDDSFLRPVLANDGLLFELEEEELEDTAFPQLSREEGETSGPKLPPLQSFAKDRIEAHVSGARQDMRCLIEALRRENDDLRLELVNLNLSPVDVEPLKEANGVPHFSTREAAGESEESDRQPETSSTEAKGKGTVDPVRDGKSGQGSGEPRPLSCLKQPGGKVLTKKVSFSSVAEKERRAIDSSYFGSYSAFGIHREMLSDRVRTQAYQDAIEGNPSLFGKATVMDVGAGTGILSLFAARAGAGKVVSIDGSARMVAVARHVAADNGMLSSSHCQAEKELVEERGPEKKEDGNGVLMFVNGMVEELGNGLTVDDQSVDVLISEWMGYCLLYESMLDSVIHARDKWLRPGGAMLPDTATMYIAGIGKGGTSLPFWENVYGFDMSYIGKEMVVDAAQMPIIDIVGSEHVITAPQTLRHFDLVTISTKEVMFNSDFQLKIQSKETRDTTTDGGEAPHETGAVEQDPVLCYGVVVWFDVAFTERFCKEKSVVLSTSPHGPPTHWSQTILTFREPIALLPHGSRSGSLPGNPQKEADSIGTLASPAVSISGRFSLARSSRHRSIDISLELTAVSGSGISRVFPAQLFDL